jgi:hypothetical protein
VQPQGRYWHETRPERFVVECKARNGEKPHVPATQERKAWDDLPPQASSAEGDETP